MNFNELLENKPLLFGIIGGTVLILALILTVGIVSSSKNSASSGVEVTGEPLKENIDLLIPASDAEAVLLSKYSTQIKTKFFLADYETVSLFKGERQGRHQQDRRRPGALLPRRAGGYNGHDQAGLFLQFGEKVRGSGPGLRYDGRQGGVLHRL